MRSKLPRPLTRQLHRHRIAHLDLPRTALGGELNCPDRARELRRPARAGSGFTSISTASAFARNCCCSAKNGSPKTSSSKISKSEPRALPLRARNQRHVGHFDRAELDLAGLARRDRGAEDEHVDLASVLAAVLLARLRHLLLGESFAGKIAAWPAVASARANRPTAGFPPGSSRRRKPSSLGSRSPTSPGSRRRIRCLLLTSFSTRERRPAACEMAAHRLHRRAQESVNVPSRCGLHRIHVNDVRLLCHAPVFDPHRRAARRTEVADVEPIHRRLRRLHGARALR